MVVNMAWASYRDGELNSTGSMSTVFLAGTGPRSSGFEGQWLSASDASKATSTEEKAQGPGRTPYKSSTENRSLIKTSTKPIKTI
jgi:hypothetical protein